MPVRARFDFEKARHRYLSAAFDCYAAEFETVLPHLEAQLEFGRRVVAVFLSPDGEYLRREYAHLVDEEEGCKAVVLAAARLAGREVFEFYSESDEWDRFDFFEEDGWDVAGWLASGRHSGSLWLH